MPFSESDRAIVDFERGWRLVGGAKSTAIRSELGLSASSYYRRLAELVDSADALAYDPLVIRRLRRERLRRRAERFAGPFASGRTGR